MSGPSLACRAYRARWWALQAQAEVHVCTAGHRGGQLSPGLGHSRHCSLLHSRAMWPPLCSAAESGSDPCFVPPHLRCPLALCWCPVTWSCSVLVACLPVARHLRAFGPAAPSSSHTLSLSLCLARCRLLRGLPWECHSWPARDLRTAPGPLGFPLPCSSPRFAVVSTCSGSPGHGPVEQEEPHVGQAVCQTLPPDLAPAVRAGLCPQPHLPTWRLTPDRSSGILSSVAVTVSSLASLPSGDDSGRPKGC